MTEEAWKKREAEFQEKVEEAYWAAEEALFLYWDDPEPAIDALSTWSWLQNSGARLQGMLEFLEQAPPPIFWPAFLDTWIASGNTWDCRAPLLRMLRNNLPSLPYLSEEERAHLAGLPDQIEVWRGCSRERVRGVAWTTDRMVAAGFARGHRGITVPDPVVASAVIPKKHVFFATNDRKELEIVLDPRRLRRLKIEPYVCEE